MQRHCRFLRHSVYILDTKISVVWDSPTYGKPPATHILPEEFFCPRDAMLARYSYGPVSVSVCHKPVMCRHGSTDPTLAYGPDASLAAYHNIGN